jgi:hypothetical protein
MKKTKIKLPKITRNNDLALPNGAAPTSPPPAAIKLDLSYGDITPGYLRLLNDINILPWPLADCSVDEAFSAYLFHRIHKDIRFQFMDQLWRVMKPGAKCTVIVPYWTSVRAIQDPTAEWPPISEQSFLYFNKQFREDNRIPGRERWKSDFDFVYGYQFEAETQNRPDEARAHWVKHYNNAINDLQLVLTRR